MAVIDFTKGERQEPQGAAAWRTPCADRADPRTEGRFLRKELAEERDRGGGSGEQRLGFVLLDVMGNGPGAVTGALVPRGCTREHHALGVGGDNAAVTEVLEELLGGGPRVVRDPLC